MINSSYLTASLSLWFKKSSWPKRKNPADPGVPRGTPGSSGSRLVFYDFGLAQAAILWPASSHASTAPG